MQLGNVAPNFGGRGVVCHCQHLQLLAPHLPFYCPLPSGPLTDLTGSHAPGHPQVPFHLLAGAACLCQRAKPALFLLWNTWGQQVQGDPLQSSEQCLLNVKFYFILPTSALGILFQQGIIQFMFVCISGYSRHCSHYFGLYLAWFPSTWRRWSRAMNSQSLLEAPCSAHTTSSPWSFYWTCWSQWWTTPTSTLLWVVQLLYCIVEPHSFALWSLLINWLFFLSGSRRYRMEIRQNKIMDELFWRGGDFAFSVQYNT